MEWEFETWEFETCPAKEQLGRADYRIERFVRRPGVPVEIIISQILTSSDDPKRPPIPGSTISVESAFNPIAALTIKHVDEYDSLDGEPWQWRVLPEDE